MECPFCGKPIDTFFALAHHMSREHNGASVGSQTFRVSERSAPATDYVWIDCWCGDSYFTILQWAVHLEVAGMPLHFMRELFK